MFFQFKLKLRFPSVVIKFVLLIIIFIFTIENILMKTLLLSFSCEQGWRGSGCNECVPRSGCEHGTCSTGEALSCQCDQGWLGPLCNCPRCKEGKFSISKFFNPYRTR